MKLMGFLKDESGQSTTEYILILAVVVIIAMKFKDKMGDVMDDATSAIGEKITGTIDELE